MKVRIYGIFHKTFFWESGPLRLQQQGHKAPFVLNFGRLFFGRAPLAAFQVSGASVDIFFPPSRTLDSQPLIFSGGLDLPLLLVPSDYSFDRHAFSRSSERYHRLIRLLLVTSLAGGTPYLGGTFAEPSSLQGGDQRERPYLGPRLAVPVTAHANSNSLLLLNRLHCKAATSASDPTSDLAWQFL
jgi:hypothetical protein